MRGGAERSERDPPLGMWKGKDWVRDEEKEVGGWVARGWAR